MCFFKSPSIPQQQTLGVTAQQLVPETTAPDVNAPVFGSSETNRETGATTGISSLKVPKMIPQVQTSPATTGANKAFNVQM